MNIDPFYETWNRFSGRSTDLSYRSRDILFNECYSSMALADAVWSNIIPNIELNRQIKRLVRSEIKERVYN